MAQTKNIIDLDIVVSKKPTDLRKCLICEEKIFSQMNVYSLVRNEFNMEIFTLCESCHGRVKNKEIENN